MKFIRGKENQIINLAAIEIIDIIENEGKYEIQAKLVEFSVVLADFEVMDHAKDYMDKLWQNAFDGRCDHLGNLLESQNSLAS